MLPTRKPRFVEPLLLVVLLIAGCTGAGKASEADRSGPGVPTPEPPRSDGLSGAPVPSLTSESARFDANRLDANALAFPPLTEPGVVTADEASWLQPETLVLGGVQDGEARAYPLFIMQFHHVVNDTLGGRPYLVTF